MAQNSVSLPAARWAGESPSRENIGAETNPDAFDWIRMTKEFLALQDLALLLFANTAPSDVHTNNAVATLLSTQYTLPANKLNVGDVLSIKIRGISPSTNSTDTLAIALKIGSVTLTTIAAADAVDNQEYFIEAELFVTATNKALVRCVKSNFAAPDSWTVSQANLAEQTIDFTATQLIGVLATWSVANAGNQTKLTQMVVERKRYLAA